MIRVKRLFGPRQVDDFVGSLLPRQGHEPIQVGTGDGELGGRGGHLGEAVELPEGFFLHTLGHSGRFNLFAQLLDFARLIVAFAELLLNGLHLLAKEVLPLVSPDLRLHLGLDFRTKLENLELLDQHPVQRVEARMHLPCLEHLLLHLRADGRQTRGDEVREPSGIGDVRGERLQVVGEERRERDHLLKIGANVPQQRVDLEIVDVGRDFGRQTDARAEVRPDGRDFVKLQTRESLHDQPETAVGQLEHLVNVARGTERVQIGLLRLFDGGIALREDANQLTAGNRLVDQPDRAFARDGQRHERVREKNGVAERENRELVGKIERPIG
jgi:hypothetical protein